MLINPPNPPRVCFFSGLLYLPYLLPIYLHPWNGKRFIILVYPAGCSIKTRKVMSHPNKALLTRNFNTDISARGTGKHPARATHTLSPLGLYVYCHSCDSMQVDNLVSVLCTSIAQRAGPVIGDNTSSLIDGAQSDSYSPVRVPMIG